MLAGLPTDHMTLNRHVTVMKTHTGPLSPVCMLQRRILRSPFWASALATLVLRYSLYGEHVLHLKIHSMLNHLFLYHFHEPLRGFLDLRLCRDVHFISAEDGCQCWAVGSLKTVLSEAKLR